MAILYGASGNTKSDTMLNRLAGRDERVGSLIKIINKSKEVNKWIVGYNQIGKLGNFVDQSVAIAKKNKPTEQTPKPLSVVTYKLYHDKCKLNKR